ncbi:MAG: GNAT family N-acetyltransferase [Sphingopyxis sp.]|uniref:GNAT family N-acetyltransferase n=1 Tax=Sphingopyxis sp. TaxID=1908224 RepID=UPI002ABB349E|nr:GNAT family N-acetyltransferase [Sphingopyxis sp.]MDZ3832292.1 GNAT family N-acetyltransferase [Sphingopyxis sp.]
MSYCLSSASFLLPTPPPMKAVALGPCDVRLVRPQSLSDRDRAHWAQLSAAAGGGNIFAHDWFMDAALRHADREEEVRLAIVSEAQEGWIGVIPLVAERRFGRWPVGAWASWLATNQFLGTPLVIPDHAEAFWRALLTHLDAHSRGQMLFFVRQLAFDDPVSAALFAHCAAERRAIRMVERFERPARRPGEPIIAQGDGKAQSRLRSLRRRLERDHGTVAIDTLTAGEPGQKWIDHFLAMERDGWKGRVGSALGCHAATETLFREVAERGHANGTLRLATLRAGDRPLAMTSWFETGAHGYGFKMTFDEAFRTYAPGQQLMQHVADQVAARPEIYFDTCTPQRATSCRSMWQSKRTIFNGAVAIGSAPRRAGFEALMNARAAYAALRRRLR